MLIHVSKYPKIGKNGASGGVIRIFPPCAVFSEKQNYFRFSYSEILQCSFYFVTSQK